MNLKKYNKNLFEELSSWIVFEFDDETKQYSLINDSTPGIYWVWITKKEAVSEYISSFEDMILINEKRRNKQNITVT